MFFRKLKKENEELKKKIDDMSIRNMELETNSSEYIYSKLYSENIKLEQELSQVKMKMYALEAQLKRYKKITMLSKGLSGFSKSDFTEEEMKQLITLCHPDKHGNSELSNRVTSKLNAMRRQK